MWESHICRQASLGSRTTGAPDTNVDNDDDGDDYGDDGDDNNDNGDDDTCDGTFMSL